MQNRRVFKEPLLDGHLPEDVQALLEMYDLKRMPAGNVDGVLDKGDGRESTSKLVDLDWEEALLAKNRFHPVEPTRG